MYSHVEHTCSC